MKKSVILAVVILVVIVLFGILFFSDKISEGELIGQVNDSVIKGVGVACEQDSDCSNGLVCDTSPGVCYDACSRCFNGCRILGPNAGACLDPTEDFNCKLINGVCTKITGETVCGDGVCELATEGPGCEAPLGADCAPYVRCPEDCEKNDCQILSDEQCDYDNPCPPDYYCSLLAGPRNRCIPVGCPELCPGCQ